MNAPTLKLLVESAAEFADSAAPDSEAEGAWPAPLDLEELAKHEPEQPRFIIDGWLPCGYATLFAGHGGVGKSGIALHLAVCAALEIAFFGVPVKQRRVMYLSCEDRENILHWRLSRICSYLGVNLASLAGKLDIVDLVGRETVLYERDPRTGHIVTAAFGTLEQRMQAAEIEMLFVDGINDTYGGNGGSATEVKRYVNRLVGLIPEDRGAVLLIGHVAKPTAASNAPTTEGYMGSTGWHNSVRARWYLFPETERDDDGKSSRSGDLILELQKSNLGRIDQTMRFKWDDDASLFVGKLDQASTFDRQHRDKEERRGILLAFRACETSTPPIIVPAAMQGPRTANAVLSIRPEYPKSLCGKANSARFRRQIEELRQSHAIEEAEYRRSNRHVAAQFKLTTEGLRQCAEY